MSSRKFALAFTAVMFSSCAVTQIAPQAEKVKVTENAADVARCTMIEQLENKQRTTAEDGVNQLRNKTAAAGGDTVLLTTTGLRRGLAGIAYRCADAAR